MKDRIIIITDHTAKGFGEIKKLAEERPELGLRFYGVRYHDDFDDSQIENRNVIVNRAGVAVLNYEPTWGIEYPDGLKIIPSLWEYIEGEDCSFAYSEGEEREFIAEVLKQ